MPRSFRRPPQKPGIRFWMLRMLRSICVTVWKNGKINRLSTNQSASDYVTIKNLRIFSLLWNIIITWVNRNGFRRNAFRLKLFWWTEISHVWTDGFPLLTEVTDYQISVIDEDKKQKQIEIDLHWWYVRQCYINLLP